MLNLDLYNSGKIKSKTASGNYFENLPNLNNPLFYLVRTHQLNWAGPHSFPRVREPARGIFFPTGLTKGARRSDLTTEAVRTYGFLPPSEETHRGWAGTRAAMECTIEDEELDDGVAKRWRSSSSSA
jgi:hypothetical protein